MSTVAERHTQIDKANKRAHEILEWLHAKEEWTHEDDDAMITELAMIGATTYFIFRGELPHPHRISYYLRLFVDVYDRATRETMRDMMGQFFAEMKDRAFRGADDMDEEKAH